MTYFYRHASASAVALLLALTAGFAPAGERTSETAAFALRQAGRRKGICVVVGETDGKLTSAIAAGSGMYVQGCTRNAAGVAAARKVLVNSGVVTRSSIVLREGGGLPYADNLLNLVVCPKLPRGDVSPEEVLRVLAPGGVGVLGGANGARANLSKAGVSEVKTAGAFLVFTKPLDPDMGDWTHIRAGADQSYTSSDKVVAPWKELRWIGDPRWGSLYLSYGGLVTTGGRIYYKECHRAGGGSQWHLVCRDAFNGYELWRKNSGPVQRRIRQYLDLTFCCDDSRVFLVEDRVLVARDALTGKRLREYPGFSPRTATSAGPVLLVSNRSGCAAFHKESGKILWKRKGRGHPASDGKTAFVASGDTLEAVDLLSGASRCKGKIAGMPAKVSQAFIVDVKFKGRTVYVVAREKWKPFGMVSAHDAATGRQLWKRNGKFSHGVLPFEDEIWCMSRDNKNKVDNMSALVLEPSSGKEKSGGQIKGSVMAKCWGARASANYVMYSNGWYVERKSRQSFGHPSTRSPCGLGQHPANGLTYFMPHHCDCKVTIRGFLAMSRPGARKWFANGKAAGDTKLFRGSAGASGGAERATDWPTYRADLRRSSSRDAALPSSVKKLWSQKLGKCALTQATGAYGTVFAAERISGRVFAREAAGGKEKWSFVADGRVEYPPTLAGGRCVFGTCAGSVYCLDAASGKMIWRLRAAPTQKFVGDRNRLDSPWPVNGSVMVMKGTAYVSAGRSSCQTGGGLWHMAVDLAGGSVKWRKKAGGAGDMFVSDGKLLRSAMRLYNPADGARKRRPLKLPGVLQTTRYLGSVSVTDYVATVEPNLSYKKHIDLTDGRIRGDCVAFNAKTSVAGWRYTPGVPGWKDKSKTGKWFMHASGATKWRLHDIKQHIMGIVVAGERTYAVGRPTSYDPRGESELWVLSTEDGKKLQTVKLPGVPVYDGLSAVGERLYVASEDGTLTCYGR
jgi:outer membrane protein assembly factor BamB